jgi:hypothetical protein
MRWLTTILGVCLVGLAGTVSAQQSTATSTAVKQFEIVSVDGNRVVVRGDQGAQEVTVSDDFRLTVNGKAVTVKELKPGMKGTATITTTTTSTPVHVTEVRNGEVMQKVGNSIIVRGEKGIQMFTEGDVTKRGIRIIRDGRPINFVDLRQGDRLTATIVTEGPPKIMTQRDVEASLTSAAAVAAKSAAPAASPGAGAATPAPAAGAAATSGTGADSGRRLPKTASPLPLLGLLGVASLAAGLVMTALRRRRSA